MEIEFWLLGIEGERIGDRDVVKLIGKTSDGKRIVIYDKSYYDYFYVRPKGAVDIEKFAEKIKKMKIERENRIIAPVNVEILEMPLLRKKEKVVKVTIKASADFSYIKEEIKKEYEREEFESDISIERHYFLDKRIPPFSKLRCEVKEIGKNIYELIEIKEVDENDILRDLKILGFDIETYNPHGIANPKRDPIIMISVYSKDFVKTILWKETTEENTEVVRSEKELFYRFMRILKEYDPDIIVGYNSDSFDFWYLRERAKELGIDLEICGEKPKLVRRGRNWVPKIEKRIIIDFYTFVNNILSPTLRTEVLNLNAVAKEILGEEKTLEKKEVMSMGEIWDRGNIEEINKLVRYNQKDAELVYRLFMEYKDFIFELSRLVCQNIYDVSRMTYGQIVEWFLMKELKKKGEMLLNRPKDEEINLRRRITYTGALVLEPKPGVYEKITCIDFRSLYPTIIITYNISPDSKFCSHPECQSNGIDAEIMGKKQYVWFCKKVRGYVPEFLERIFKERIKLKKKLKELKKGTEEYKLVYSRQYALKTVMNATYGYFGFPNARYYDVEISASITAFGRYWISKVIEKAKKEGFSVIYSDTDSIFIAGKEKETALKFLERLNEEFPGVIQMDFEDFYLRGLWIGKKGKEAGAKKKYALINEEGKITVKGLEIVRRDWAKIARETQKKVIKDILLGKKREEILNDVKEIIEKIRKHELDIEEFVIYEQITRDLSQYTSKNIPHLVAARRLQKLGYKIVPGVVIGYIITEGGGSISDKAYPLEWVIKKGMTYDANYYINNQVIPAIERILEVIGITTGEVLGKGRQTTLFSFARR